MNRYKPVGWRNDSYRHSLAARGYRTSMLGKISKIVDSKVDYVPSSSDINKDMINYKKQYRNFMRLLDETGNSPEESKNRLLFLNSIPEDAVGFVARRQNGDIFVDGVFVGNIQDMEYVDNSLYNLELEKNALSRDMKSRYVGKLIVKDFLGADPRINARIEDRKSEAMRTMFAARGIKKLGIRNYPQKTNYTCGPAALKMVMKYHGVNKSEKSLAKAAGTTRSSGTYHDGMKKAANKFGFDLEVKKGASISDIRHHVNDLDEPVIVDWFPEGGGHYSVVKGINDHTMVLDDPAYHGARKVPIKDFNEAWFDYNGRTPKNNKFYTKNMLIVRPKK